MNRENLDKLASYLEQLPADYSHFNMGVFADGEGVAEYLATATIQCGTAACAVGHGPAAGLAMTEEELALLLVLPNRVRGYDTWGVYSERVFDIKQNGPRWEWMFGGGWCGKDDTPHGAAKRIRYILEGFDPPMIIDEYGCEEPFDSCEATLDHVKLYNGETA